MGLGEIGKAIKELCVEVKHDVCVIEKDWRDCFEWNNCDVLMVNIPYNDEFIESVMKIIEETKPKMTIINSTVPVGTTRMLQEISEHVVIHSPVRGIHPHLKEGILTFVKYVGATDTDKAQRVIDFFKTLNVKARAFNNPEETELAKLLCTTTYGMYIAWATEIKRICDEKGLDFDNVYTDLTQTYNSGYIKLGMGYVMRPVLKPNVGGFSGHCVFENTQLLKELLNEDWKKHIDKIGKKNGIL